MKKDDFDKINLISDGKEDIIEQLIGETINLKGAINPDNTLMKIKVLEIKSFYNAAAYSITGEVNDKILLFLASIRELYDKIDELGKKKSILRDIK